MITYEGVDVSVPLEERENYLSRVKKSLTAGDILLSTCDRIEVYRGTGRAEEGALRHLFRVVSGLESPMLGENQIQAQVKKAYLDAAAAGGLTAGMHKLFQAALHVGKRVRTETKLNHGALGHAQTVVSLLKELTIPITELRILVIGINNLNRGILRYLVEEGHQTFLLGNRTLDKAHQMVAELQGGQAFPLEQLPDKLATVDVVISATSAPHLIVHVDQLPPQGGPRWFFDLAVPRDIDPAIGQRPGVNLFNVTDLEQAAQKNLVLRRAEVDGAEAIIDTEVKKFLSRGEP